MNQESSPKQVESRNGHAKTIFKFLAHTISTTHLENIGDYYRIAGALINRYHPLINMQGMDVQKAIQMLEQAQTPNVVQALVEAEQLHRRNAQRWVGLGAQHVTDFPRLTEEDIKNITVGVYQLGLAPSYVQDKLQRQDNDEYQLELMLNEDRLPESGFLRVRTFSRFRNATRHQAWIAYRSSEQEAGHEDEDEDGSLILGYYCTCYSGARTLGTCAHIASILWFLGYARYIPDIRFPSSRLLDAILDAENRPPQQPILL